MENVPDATLGIQRELDLSKKRVAELKENLERVMETLAQAQEQLEQRSLDQKLLAAAKSTSSQLKVSSRTLGACSPTRKSRLCLLTMAYGHLERLGVMASYTFTPSYFGGNP